MKAKTKAEIAAELDQANATVAALLDMLDAIHEVSESAPIAAADESDWKELSRKSSALSAIKAMTDQSDYFTAKPHYIASYAKVLREAAAEPLKYKPYVPEAEAVSVLS